MALHSLIVKHYVVNSAVKNILPSNSLYIGLSGFLRQDPRSGIAGWVSVKYKKQNPRIFIYYTC